MLYYIILYTITSYSRRRIRACLSVSLAPLTSHMRVLVRMRMRHARTYIPILGCAVAFCLQGPSVVELPRVNPGVLLRSVDPVIAGAALVTEPWGEVRSNPLRVVAPVPYSRVSAEVTFGRGDLSVCPLGGFTGAHDHLISFLIGGVSPRGPRRDNH